MKALWLGATLALLGCNAVTRGARLSNVPFESGQVFLSTGGAPRPYRVIGFVQVRGYGVTVAGLADLGDARLDGPIHGSLVTEAVRLGGNGVINIEFLDENPLTDYERASRAVSSFSSFSGGNGVDTVERYVTVTGEVIQFLE